MKKALGYLRISKDEDGSVSLDYQRSSIEKYCIREDLTLIGFETDDGISGQFIQARPAVKRVLQAVNNREVDAVVVYKSDRISRDGIERLEIENLFLKGESNTIPSWRAILRKTRSKTNLCASFGPG